MAKSIIPLAGLWGSIAALFNAMFDDIYNKPLHGIYDYNDLATHTTPITVPGTNTYVYITNDGLGQYSSTEFSLPGITNVYDTSLNQFDWGDLVLGDTVDIRLDLTVITTTPNQSVDVDLEMGIGSGAPYDILFSQNIFKAAGNNPVNRFTSVYMGNTLTLNNPAKFKIRSDAAATVVVNGWYCRVFPRFRKV